MIMPPPQSADLTHGCVLRSGLGISTVLADFDFETYSAGGYEWDPKINKWGCLRGASKKGIGVVGAAKYSEHSDAEVLCLAYNLKDGLGNRIWIPGLPDPEDLFLHVQQKKLIEAWNVGFEYWIWTNICVPKYGFPPLDPELLRCAAAKARAFALPGSLANAGEVLNITHKKDKRGTQLLNKFSIPKNPDKKNTRLRIKLSDEPLEGQALIDYCKRDIEAEAELSSLIPDLIPVELEFWKYDQKINRRGMQIDLYAINNCMLIIEQAHKKYNSILKKLAGVNKASECAKIIKWLNTRGIVCYDLTAATIKNLLTVSDLHDDVRQVLEIRSMIGSAAVKKLYSMANQVTKDGRLHDLYIYHSARTGRAAGAGPQPQNLPNSGPLSYRCECGKYRAILTMCCPWCGEVKNVSEQEWNINAVEDALITINTGSLSCVEFHFGNAVAAVSGCLRGLFIAAPGHDLICSDYSAIEAVVLAELAGEKWRQDVFRTHGKIYEMSASKIAGIPFEEFERHKRETGQHHPLRKKIGKVAELASGYGGWVVAWQAFGADEFFNEQEIKNAIIAWRNASPAIVEFWGGQKRYGNSELFGVEGTTVMAIANPGTEFYYRGLVFICHNNVFYIKLLSGRYLTYHQPRLVPHFETRRGLQISYMGWNTNPKMGMPGWSRIQTYGGRLVENIVQATARDLLAHAIVNLEKNNYPVVLHVHDEICSEVFEQTGSLEEFEKIMSTMPSWASDWPVKASGGWRGKRYRK